jgi:hypothetical protein
MEQPRGTAAERIMASVDRLLDAVPDDEGAEAGRQEIIRLAAALAPSVPPKRARDKRQPKP